MAILRFLVPLTTLALVLSGTARVPHDEILARQYGENDSNGDDDDDTTVTEDTATTSNSTGSTVTGDRQCGTNMCVTAIVNDTSIEYQLSTTGTREAGWMAIGFGTSMSDNSGMVVIWANDDGTFTLSQRTSSGQREPEVDSNPSRVATLESSVTTTSGTDATFVFTMDATSDTTQDIIYAFGTTNPGSSDPSSSFIQHLEGAAMQLDLTGTIDTGSDDSSDTDSDGDSTGSTGSTSTPLLPYQKTIVAHGILCTIGFLLFLPFGSLLARYMRTFSNSWYTGHWISQFALGGPIILVGFILGFVAVNQAGAPHLDDNHKRWGVAIFVLYVIQCSLGSIIHYLKPKNSTRRPFQNYFHAVLGLAIIGLAFYQVRTGFMEEWENTTGRDPVPNSANLVWYIWVVLVPVLYAIGLLFLKKQYRQERQARVSKL